MSTASTDLALINWIPGVKTAKKLIKLTLLAAGAGLIAYYFAGGGKRSTGPVRLLVVGDSLTAAGIYPKALASLLGPRLEAVSYQGWTGKGPAFIAQQLQASSISFNPTHIIVLAGVNAIGSGYTVAWQELQQLWQKLQLTWPEAELIVVQLTPWAGYATSTAIRQVDTLSLNSLIKRSPMPAAVVNPATLGDAQGYLRSGYSADGLHMNQAGYQQLAKLIYNQAF